VTTTGAYTRVLQVSEVPPGTKRTVEVAGQSILVCHSNGLFAVANLCSHANEKLECGRLSRGWISCPAHGARFDLATGRAMNPPAKQPIATYPVRVVDDWIEVAVHCVEATPAQPEAALPGTA
jgi:3-phenylpropionate/trans-cinnamate dioxygenase ferredoxin subunit